MIYNTEGKMDENLILEVLDNFECVSFFFNYLCIFAFYLNDRYFFDEF